MTKPGRRRGARRRATRVAVAGLAIAAALTALVAGCTHSAPTASPTTPTSGAKALAAIVLWDGTAVNASGTAPAATAVVPTGAGRFKVTFPGLATPGGIVHVTAINRVPHWCQPESWGPSGTDETVIIGCYAAGGVSDPSAFTAFFTSRFGAGATGLYGYVDAKPGGTIVSEYNSAGSANIVTPVGVGETRVTLPGLGSPGPIHGSWQTTAVHDTGRRCKIRSWLSTLTGQEATIICFDAAGVAVDTRFTVSFQDKTASYGETAQLLPLVTFPSIGVSPDTVQVTAYGDTSAFCGLYTLWAHIGGDTLVRNVCYSNDGGVPVAAGFLVSANTIP